MSNRDNNEQEDVVNHLEALGYVDPGIGSVFIQAFLAIYFRFRRSVRKVWWGGRRRYEEI